VGGGNEARVGKDRGLLLIKLCYWGFRHYHDILILESVGFPPQMLVR
jgi:hypothetical protein